MTTISGLLLRGAQELRAIARKNDPHGSGANWIARCADRMVAASNCEPIRQEQEVQAIAHAFVDSGPTDEAAAPSFWEAVEALRRLKGRK
jgi:hypothetical protein